MPVIPHPSPVIRHRQGLPRTRAALAAGKLTVGFLGGSITAPHPGKSWPEPLLAWLVNRFPQVRVTVENGAIGATGSDLAAFRASDTVLPAKCDLVFVEYAVNDYGTATDFRNRTREGLLRQLLATGCDVVLAYTYFNDMKPDMEAGRVPPSIAEFETLADHYGLGSVWMGLHAWHEVHAGLMTWPEWLPDGIHPENRGSLSYATSVIAYLEKELAASPAPAPRPALPPALYAGNWEKVRRIPFDAVQSSGPWTVRRWYTCPGIDWALHTTAPGATLKFAFDGYGLALVFHFHGLASEVRYRVDGGEWAVTKRDRPEWCNTNGWPRLLLVTDTLQAGRHEFELETLAEPLPLPQGCGTLTTIGMIGVIG
jgi:lysophospholipase L1-like esterase